MFVREKSFLLVKASDSYITYFKVHLRSKADGTIVDARLYGSFLGGNTFQKRRVSSPAPVTKVCPSGLQERYRTLKVWPVRVASFFIEGYFHTTIWFCE